MARRAGHTKRRTSQVRSTRSAKEFEGGFLLRVKVSTYKNHTTITLSYKRPRLTRHFIPKATAFTRQVSRKFAAPALIIIGLVGLIVTLRPYVGSTAMGATHEAPASLQAVQSLPEQRTPTTLSRSEPTELHIPSIQLSAGIIATSTNENGELVVPEAYDIAAWYNQSPTPGEAGPSVIVGHLSSHAGNAIFSNLHTLAIGSEIRVKRADERTAIFTVERLASFSQSSFPALEVYGNTERPELRLITCSGTYNYITGRYTENTVVFARMDEASTQRATND